MVWKNLDYWKKCGLIGVFVYLILFIIEGLVYVITNGGSCVEACSAGSGLCSYAFTQCFETTLTYNIIPFFLFNLFARVGVSQAYLNDYLLNGVTSFLVSVIIFFLIGSVIGWLIRKKFN